MPPPWHEEEVPMNAAGGEPVSGAARGSRALKLAGVLAAGAVAALGFASLGYIAGSARRADLAATVEDVAIEIRPPWMLCSEPDENCMGTKCCKWAGSRCYTKNDTFAACHDTCGTSETADWACKKLAHWDEGDVMASAASGPELFCFEAFMVDLGKARGPCYDLELVRAQLQKGASVFGCAAWRVFADKVVEIGPGNPGPPHHTTQVETPHLEVRRMNGHWLNGPQFINIWAYIRDTKIYEPYQWTVKVDVDAVFLPQRLVARLVDKPVPEKGLYITNCWHGADALIGALEVISRSAVRNFVANLELCTGALNWKAPGHMYGEDKFFQRCMYKIGVETAEDFSLLHDNLCAAAVQNRVRAEKEHKKPDSKHLWKQVVAPKCHNTSFIAFHPLSKPEDYFACLAATQRK